jgi:hypothetical protein
MLRAIIDLDPPIATGAFELRVPYQQLHGSEIAGLLVDLCCFRSTHRVGAVGRSVEPRTLDPSMDDASVLPSREMGLGSGTGSARSEFDLRHPIMDRGPSLLRDFELDRSPSLFLNHGATVSHPAAGAYVVDLQAD